MHMVWMNLINIFMIWQCTDIKYDNEWKGCESECIVYRMSGKIMGVLVEVSMQRWIYSLQ